MASSSKGKSKSKGSRVRGYSGKGSGLKANNAGYSTTNRKGETTYFKSSKDAGGYNDSFEGKGTTSAGKPLKTVDSGGNVITPNKLQNTGVANIPGAPVVSDVGDLFNSNNQASATNIADFGYSYDKNKGFAPIPSVANDTVEASQGRSLQNMMARFGLQQAPESKADLYNSLKEKKDVDRARKEVNNYASQLNAISSNADAEALGLEGQGRGITESIIGGQQAQIRREAAIQALPVQAQLSAAQGNLDLAQQQLSTMFQLKSTDADAKYNYRNKVIDSVYDFANAQEKQRLDDLKQIQLEKKAETKDFLNTQAQVLANALGQGAPASVYNAINNAKDKTALINAAGIYNGDVLGQEAKRLQIKQANANLYTESLQQQKLLAELNPTGDPGASADLEAYGGEFASTGKLPSPAALKAANLTAGQVSAYAKQVPKSVGTLVSKNTGATPTGIGAAEQDDIKRLYNITQMTAQLAELDKKRVGGLVAGGFGKLFGSEAQGAYLTQRKAIVDEIARMQTGAALTNDEQAFYNDYLPGRLSESFGLGQGSDKKIENFSKLMNDKLNNSLANNQLSVIGYSKVNVPGLGNKTVGENIEVQGNQYRVLPDGTLTDVI